MPQQVDVMEISEVVLQMAEKYFDFNSCCADPRADPRDPGCEVQTVMACRQRFTDEELGKSVGQADPNGRGYLKGRQGLVNVP